MTLWRWAMRMLGLLGRRPVPEHEPLTEQQRARTEADLRYWRQREDAVREVAALQSRDRD